MKRTSIEWTDETINFWMGCKKVSDGCKYCYMYRDFAKYGRDAKVFQLVQEKTILKKLRDLTPGSRIFTCSWSDFFWDAADEHRAWAWDIIRKHPQFHWQILTKRPERILQCLPPDWGEGWPHVWLGVSVESAEHYHMRMLALINVPAKIRFLSMEPLLSLVDMELDSFRLHPHSGLQVRDSIHWIIVGGESGNENGLYKYRTCHARWIKFVITQCDAEGVPVFVKQLGTHLAKELKLKDRKGGNMDEWPEEFKVREFPKLQAIL